MEEKFIVCDDYVKVQNFINDVFPGIHTKIVYDGVSYLLAVYLETDLEFVLLNSYLIAKGVI